jgi:hypothetical protein
MSAITGNDTRIGFLIGSSPQVGGVPGQSRATIAVHRHVTTETPERGRSAVAQLSPKGLPGP